MRTHIILNRAGVHALKKNFNKSKKGDAVPSPLSEEARKLAESHRELATRIAWKVYESYYRIMPLDELRGEALCALVYAAGRFEAGRDVPFGAYATIVIMHRLTRAITIWRRSGRLAHTRFADLLKPLEREYLVACHRTIEAVEQVAINDLFEHVRLSLPPRWFRVLQLYYAEGRTFEEIGSELGFSRERARQLLAQAISRVRRKMPTHIEPRSKWDLF